MISSPLFFLRLTANSGGNSSPDIGAFPFPTRFRIRAIFAGLARCALAAKYSSVRTAEALPETLRLTKLSFGPSAAYLRNRRRQTSRPTNAQPV